MLAVDRSGNVLVYNLDGEIVNRWNLGEECGSILDAYIWNGGLVVLSSSYRFYAVLNIVFILFPSTSSLKVYVAKMEQTKQFSKHDSFFMWTCVVYCGDAERASAKGACAPRCTAGSCTAVLGCHSPVPLCYANTSCACLSGLRHHPHCQL